MAHGRRKRKLTIDGVFWLKNGPIQVNKMICW
jgi:hypothetical protein